MKPQIRRLGFFWYIVRDGRLCHPPYWTWNQAMAFLWWKEELQKLLPWGHPQWLLLALARKIYRTFGVQVFR